MAAIPFLPDERTTTRLVLPLLLLLPLHSLAGQTANLSDTLIYPRDRKCSPSDNPKHLPAVDKVVDSAALVQSLRDSGNGEGHATVTLVFDSGGTVGTATILESDLPAPASNATLEVVKNSARPQKPGREAWALRLRLASGPQASAVAEKAILCPAVAIKPGPGEIHGIIVDLDRIDRSQLTYEWRHHIPPIEVIVGTDGTPLDARILTPSGNLQVDWAFTKLASSLHYLPALMDGMPVLLPYLLDVQQTFRKTPGH